MSGSNTGVVVFQHDGSGCTANVRRWVPVEHPFACTPVRLVSDLGMSEKGEADFIGHAHMMGQPRSLASEIGRLCNNVHVGLYV